MTPGDGCPQVGSGGWHSEAYADGSGPCKWCGLRPRFRSRSTVDRIRELIAQERTCNCLPQSGCVLARIEAILQELK